MHERIQGIYILRKDYIHHIDMNSFVLPMPKSSLNQHGMSYLPITLVILRQRLEGNALDLWAAYLSTDPIHSRLAPSFFPTL